MTRPSSTLCSPEQGAATAPSGAAFFDPSGGTVPERMARTFEPFIRPAVLQRLRASSVVVEFSVSTTSRSLSAAQDDQSRGGLQTFSG